MSLSKRIYELNHNKGFKEGQRYFVRSRRFPNGVKVKCERIRRVYSGAVLAFCKDERGFKYSFPVSNWATYHIYEVRPI